MSTSEFQQTDQATLEQLEEIVRDLLGVDDISLEPSTIPGEVEGWDSLANVSILFSLEEVFGISLGDDVMASFESVGDLVAMVDRARGNEAR